ncbi:SHOCT domain-containing protein [Streptomyces sp. NPDC056061]|uniref:SHOCT domain-containing protein n=1 Tax=Streptomyces sp. NPDC056061 TaxID=3345700 RepID=UPI0035D6798C
MWYGGWGGGGWLLLTGMAVVFWLLLIAGVVALTRHMADSRSGNRPAPPVDEERWGGRRAEELLAERFARGEIDEDEYKRRLAVLRDRR